MSTASAAPQPAAAPPASGLHPVVGIDLGTTYSAVAAMNTNTGEAEILRNPVDKKSTVPSVISMDHIRKRVIVGWPAKANRAINPFNTIIEVKRWMGDQFTVETLMQLDPQGEGRGPGGRPFLPRSVDFAGDPVKVQFLREWYLPQEISAFTLMKMKEIAQAAYGGREIIDAVVTVPAYFTGKHRKATEEAALLAGLYPRQLIPEPTAAAICYGVEQFDDRQQVYLVYDLGGGTFDVSIIRVRENEIEVIATSGDRRLGGADFDNSITEWAVNELATRHGLDIRNDRRLIEIVKYHAEQLKVDLSTYAESQMALPELRPENPPTLKLDRATFQNLIDADLGKSLNYVDIALGIARKEKDLKDDVDAILLVGGSSKIPYVKERLLDHFKRGDDFVRANLNPDTVVARGAAIVAKRYDPTPPPFDIARPIQGATTTESADDLPPPRQILEHSLGVAAYNDKNEYKVTKLIPRGTNLPAEKKRGGFTNPDMAPAIVAEVYQGEHEYAVDNDLIGQVDIPDIDPQPKNTHEFEVTFKIDESGLLAVTVLHLNTGRPFFARCTSPTSAGAEALKALKDKLHSMYAPAGSDEIGTIEPVPVPAAASAPTSASQVAVPSSNGNGSVVQPPAAVQPSPVSTGPQAAPTQPVQPQAVQPQAVQPQAVQPVAATSISPVQSAAPAPVPAPHIPPAAASAEAKPPDATGIIIAQRDVPEAYKSLVRKAEKQLRKRSDPRLLRVFNEFTSSLNDGASPEDLEDCASDLQSVYDRLLMSEA